MPDFGGKKILFGNGGEGSAFNVACWIMDAEEGDYVKALVPLQNIHHLIERPGGKTAALVLTNGERVPVNMALTELERVLNENASFSEKIDLLPYTGKTYETEKLKDVFTRAVRQGKGRGDGVNMTIKFYGHMQGERLSLMDFQTKNIQNLSSSVAHAGHTYMDVTSLNCLYIPLPVSLVQQFYTHAVRCHASELDLTEVTDPAGKYQKEKNNIAQIPFIYKQTEKYRKP